MKKPIELSRKKSAYSVYVYGALDVRLFPNKRLNFDLKNIEIWVSHGLNILLNLYKLFRYAFTYSNTLNYHLLIHPQISTNIKTLRENL